MSSKQKYINPDIIKDAMVTLKKVKAQDPREGLPLYQAGKGENEETRAIYVRAAKRLGWNVVRSKGHVYENGKFIW